MLGPREVPWDCTFKNRNERITANQRQNKEPKKRKLNGDGMGWDGMQRTRSMLNGIYFDFLTYSATPSECSIHYTE